MLVGNRLLHTITASHSLADYSIDALKDELQKERTRVEALMHEVANLKSKFSQQIKGLKNRLVAEQQTCSVLRRSFTMKTVEESWATSLGQPDFIETELSQNIKALQLKVFNLEADKCELEGEKLCLKAEIETLKENIVRVMQAREVDGKRTAWAQLDEICKHMEVLCLENSRLKSKCKSREEDLQGLIDSLKSDQIGLCNELSAYSTLMNTERCNFEEKLGHLTKANLKTSQDLDDANARLRQCAKVEKTLKQAVNEMESSCITHNRQLKALQVKMANKDSDIERLENEIAKQVEEDTFTREALKKSRKENLQLKNELRTLKANYDATEGSLEDLRDQLSTATKQLKTLQKELQGKSDQIINLADELDCSREAANELKEMLRKFKDDCSRQHTDRLKALQFEKKDLEDKLKAVHEETCDTKSPFESQSLHDELSQLYDFSPVKGNPLYITFDDQKKTDALQAELEEKDKVIEDLGKENDSLNVNLETANKRLNSALQTVVSLEASKSYEICRYQALIDRLMARIEDFEAREQQDIGLKAEIERLNSELTCAKQACADEAKKLIEALRDAEFKAAEVKMHYYDAAQELKSIKQQALDATHRRGALSIFESIFKKAN